MNKYPGSGVPDGWLYQGNPFDPSRPAHRKDSQARADMIQRHHRVEGQSILDLGCNLGIFAHLLEGYKSYHGIDYDVETIAEAGKIANKRNLAATFEAATITVEKLAAQPVMDLVLCLSVLPWIVLAGADMDDVMRELARHHTVIFELMYVGDGMSRGIPGVYNDEDAEAFLRQYFRFVARLGADPKWHRRTLWKCSNDVGDQVDVLRHSTGAVVERHSNSWVTKAYTQKFPKAKRQATEIKALRLAGKYECSPAFGGTDGNVTVMTYLDGRKPTLDELRSAKREIVEVLTEMNVLHRDLKPDNFLVSRGKMFLIDWEWACDLDANPWSPAELGGPYRGEKYDNAYLYTHMVSTAVERGWKNG